MNKKDNQKLRPTQTPERKILSKIIEFLRKPIGKKQVVSPLLSNPITEDVRDNPPASKGPFPNIAMQEDHGEWYTLMRYEDAFGANVSEVEKKEKLGQLRNRLESSKLSEAKKNHSLNTLK